MWGIMVKFTNESCKILSPILLVALTIMMATTPRKMKLNVKAQGWVLPIRDHLAPSPPPQGISQSLVGKLP